MYASLHAVSQTAGRVEYEQSNGSIIPDAAQFNAALRADLASELYSGPSVTST
jgi:hypothetical protein